MYVIQVQFCLFCDALAVQVISTNLSESVMAKLAKREPRLYGFVEDYRGYPVLIMRDGQPHLVKQQAIEAIGQDLKIVTKKPFTVDRNCDGKVEIVDFIIN